MLENKPKFNFLEFIYKAINMKKTMILIIKMLLGAGLLFGLYVIGAILYAQLTDYKPKPEEDAEVLMPKDKLKEIDKKRYI